MLVLTRRIGEEIIIDGNIRIRILSVKGHNVRLGTTAPDSVSVHRKEVHDRTQASGVETAIDLRCDPAHVLCVGTKKVGRGCL